MAASTTKTILFIMLIWFGCGLIASLGPGNSYLMGDAKQGEAPSINITAMPGYNINTEMYDNDAIRIKEEGTAVTYMNTGYDTSWFSSNIFKLLTGPPQLVAYFGGIAGDEKHQWFKTFEGFLYSMFFFMALFVNFYSLVKIWQIIFKPKSD